MEAPDHESLPSTLPRSTLTREVSGWRGLTSLKRKRRHVFYKPESAIEGTYFTSLKRKRRHVFCKPEVQAKARILQA